jgi:hypothetical protein
MRVRTLFPTTLGLLVLAGSALSAPPPPDLDRRVQQFVEASNRQDVEAMIAAVDPQFRWMSVDGAKLDVEVVGAEQLRSWLEGYFRSTPEARSKLGRVEVDGHYASTVETTEFRDSKGALRRQSATSVYEFTEGGLIRAVWYFPAQEAAAPPGGA